MKVADLQMRVDRLLRGRDNCEQEGSASITMWDELVTQLCDMFVITVNKEERLECSQLVLARMKEIKNNEIVLRKENDLLKIESERYKRDYEIAQETIAKMADQISSGHATDRFALFCVTVIYQYSVIKPDN